MVMIYVGTSGNNTFNGSGGPDYMYGGTGNDTLRGSGGIDFLRGSLGNDSLYGGAGNDFLDAGENNDVARGEAGNDILVGLSGNDTLDGGTGNDNLHGGTGRDSLTGGAGADRFVFISTQDSTPSAHDQITDFSLTGGDVIDLSSIHNFSFIGTGAFSAPWQVRQGSQGGHTTVEVNTSGSGGAEMVIDLNGTGNLSEGDFILSGGVTSDNATHNVLLGNSGANAFHGGGGFDYIFGDDGNDRLYGEGDSDMVRGSYGDDLIDGGAGDDALYGGPGRDVFVSLSGRDIIQDFESGGDRIQVSSSVATSAAQLSITQQAEGPWSRSAVRRRCARPTPTRLLRATATTTRCCWPALTPAMSRPPISSSADQRGCRLSCEVSRGRGGPRYGALATVRPTDAHDGLLIRGSAPN